MRSRTGTTPPSLLLRAVVSVALLAAFYVITLAIALALLALPIAVVSSGHARIGTYLLFLFAGCWIPAILLLRGALLTRPPPFTPPGPRLSRDEAPELFSLLNDLAAQAGTAPPSEVYLAPMPTLAVTETGGRRVLILGAPLLGAVTVEELRAGLAHELGHFAGGDTSLTRVISYTVATFRSVIESVQQGAFHEGSTHSSIDLGFAAAKWLGEAWVGAYARLYFLITLASSRRQELAADTLAARLGGRDAVVRLLEKVTIVSPTYEAYLRGDVGFAVARGAMPSDVLGGYARFRARFDALPIAAKLAGDVRGSKTDRYDSHPALADRLAHLAAMDEGRVTPDPRAAIALVADAPRLHMWLADVTMSMLEPKQVLRRLEWAAIPGEVYLPAAQERARKVAASLFARFPRATSLRAMLLEVVRAYERGEVAPIVTHVFPEMERVPDQHRAEALTALGGAAVGQLFLGALLERGGTVDDSLGAPCLLANLDGELVPAEKIGADAMTDQGARALLASWAERLGSEARAS